MKMLNVYYGNIKTGIRCCFIKTFLLLDFLSFIRKSTKAKSSGLKAAQSSASSHIWKPTMIVRSAEKPYRPSRELGLVPVLPGDIP